MTQPIIRQRPPSTGIPANVQDFRALNVALQTMRQTVSELQGEVAALKNAKLPGKTETIQDVVLAQGNGDRLLTTTMTFIDGKYAGVTPPANGPMLAQGGEGNVTNITQTGAVTQYNIDASIDVTTWAAAGV